MLEVVLEPGGHDSLALLAPSPGPWTSAVTTISGSSTGAAAVIQLS